MACKQQEVKRVRKEPMERQKAKTKGHNEVKKENTKADQKGKAEE